MEFTKYQNVSVTGIIEPGDHCLVDSRVHGLFACFYCVLYGLFICELEDFKPVVYLGKNHLYFEPDYGDNLFSYFYIVEDNIETKVTAKLLVENPDPFLYWCRISNAEKKNANLLINKYFILRPEIEQQIEAFTNQHFNDQRILGVHYRGTDKIQETGLLEFDAYLDKIHYILEKNICDQVFFVTDELELKNSVLEKYGDKVLVYTHEGKYQGDYRGATGLHFSNNSPYLHAKDALMECYLLSNCTMLLSSHKSSMSLFVTFLNPDLPHIVIEP